MSEKDSWDLANISFWKMEGKEVAKVVKITFAHSYIVI